MSRFAALLVTVASALSQLLYLFAFRPMHRLVTGRPLAQRLADVRVLGVDVDGFVVRETTHAGDWLPQVLFVCLGAVLTYAVLRAVPGPRPPWRVVVPLFGVLLLTAGVVDMLGLLTGLRPEQTPPYQPEWVGDTYVDGVAGVPAQFALCVGWMPLLAVAQVRLLQRWPAFHPVVGAPQPTAPAAPVPTLSAAAPPPARRRLDMVAAGLIPVVLLALVGGRVLRHTNVRYLEQHGSVTFDPDLWRPYRPAEAVREFSGVLYPALRLRPLPTEQQAGWLATCLLCLVFLVVLAAALYALARRADGMRPVRVAVECWFATLFAAVAAAAVESGLLQHDRLAPRTDVQSGFGSLTSTLGDAVRFGTCWGWAVGVAFLVGVWAVSRRVTTTAVQVTEEGLSHAH